MKRYKQKNFTGYLSNRFLELSRVQCKCGHTVNFISNVPYIECNYCHNIIFRNKKCEYNFKVKRRVMKGGE